MERLHRRIVQLSTVTVLLTSAPFVLDAQQPPSIPVGSRIRVTTTSDEFRHHRYTGNLVSLNRDSILLDSPRRAVDYRSVKTIEVTAGRRRHPVAGMFIGAAIGGLGLALVGGLSCVGSNNSECNEGLTASESAAIGGVVGTVIGAPIGLVVGSLKIYDRWVPAGGPPRTD